MVNVDVPLALAFVEDVESDVSVLVGAMELDILVDEEVDFVCDDERATGDEDVDMEVFGEEIVEEEDDNVEVAVFPFKPSAKLPPLPQCPPHIPSPG